MDLAILRKVDCELREVRASLSQRRDVIAALSGYKASRLMLTDTGVQFLELLQQQIPFGLSVGSQYYLMSRNSAKGGFSNTMSRGLNGQGRREVFLSKDPSLAPLLIRRANDHRSIGQSLRIPPCCVEFYLNHSAQAAKRGFDYSGLIPTPKSLEAPLLGNTLARYFDRGFVDHFPCRYDCRKTALVARQLMSILQSVDRTLAGALVAEGTFIYSDDQGVFWLEPLSNQGSGDCLLKAATTDRTDLAEKLMSASVVAAFRDAKGEVSLEIRGAGHGSQSTVFESMKVVTFRYAASDCVTLPELGNSPNCV
jgi:hypothetical protein